MDCEENDSLLSWNITGSQGPKGDKGDPGEPSWNEQRILALEARVETLENPVPPPPPTCSAILCEDFNSYSNGPIVGQGGWFNRANGTPWVVQGDIVQEGLKALYNNNTGADSVITKNAGNALTDGRQSFYVRTQNRSDWGDGKYPIY